jgi:hypothetical protein
MSERRTRRTTPLGHPRISKPRRKPRPPGGTPHVQAVERWGGYAAIPMAIDGIVEALLDARSDEMSSSRRMSEIKDKVAMWEADRAPLPRGWGPLAWRRKRAGE